MNVHDEFTRRVAADRLCAAVMKAVRDGDTAALGRLGMQGFAQYAGRLSELMTVSVRGGLDFSEDFGELMRQVNSPARYAHHLVNECGAAVQTALDERNGLRLRVVQPEYNDGRTKGLIGDALSRETPEQGKEALATGLGTEVKDAGNEFMKQNAEQRSRAGFTVTVTRTGGAKCCPWCADRTGKWELANAPDGVFGCHDNCKCMVDYTNSKGTVRGRAVTHKIDGKTVTKWEFADKIPYTPPKVLTREEAAARGGFDKPKRLTGGANGGILKSRNVTTAGLMFVSHRDNLYKYAIKVPPIKGYEDVTFHADRESFQILNPETGELVQRVSPKELADLLRASANYKNTAIRLLACQSGYGEENSLAQQLANELGVKVKAPTEILAIDNTGETFISDNLVLIDMWEQGLHVEQTGKWADFEPEPEVR